MQGLSLVVASGGHSSSWCVGLPLSRPLLLRSTGSGCAGSVIVAHGRSRSAACGIFPDQGSNPCPLHWQADSQPPRHLGSPYLMYFDGQENKVSLRSYDTWISVIGNSPLSWVIFSRNSNQLENLSPWLESLIHKNLTGRQQKTDSQKEKKLIKRQVILIKEKEFETQWSVKAWDTNTWERCRHVLKRAHPGSSQLSTRGCS